MERGINGNGAWLRGGAWYGWFYKGTSHGVFGFVLMLFV